MGRGDDAASRLGRNRITSVLAGCISQGQLQNVSGVLSYSPKSLSISQVLDGQENTPTHSVSKPTIQGILHWY